MAAAQCLLEHKEIEKRDMRESRKEEAVGCYLLLISAPLQTPYLGLSNENIITIYTQSHRAICFYNQIERCVSLNSFSLKCRLGIYQCVFNPLTLETI